ncbi:MAG: hypothetical protein J5687_09550 [Treponema sp.]|nr:hypothetical protein [Treponema sp.]
MLEEMVCYQCVGTHDRTRDKGISTCSLRTIVLQGKIFNSVCCDGLIILLQHLALCHRIICGFIVRLFLLEIGCT